MVTKYRPYLTVQELNTILSALKTSSSNVTLIRYLDDFAHKISRESISPQLTLKPTLEEKLGLGNNPGLKPINSLARLKELAYKKWLSNPMSCSSSEIARSQMYRYENDLLTPEEESAYEQYHHLT